MLIVGICGSLRRESFNRRLLEAARALLPPPAQLVVWDELAAVPPFNEDDEPRPPAPVERFRTVLAEADGVLIATPEYNGSIPGQLKNALDWASRPRRACVLDRKPVAVIGASPTPFGAVRAQAELRKVLKTSGAQPLEDGLAVPRAPQLLSADGPLLDADLRGELSALLGALTAAAGQAREQLAA